ncbi:class III signal peptide-containing protein [Palaeococcus ferrophilus]|uniref:class III signal peptide-containing protein n=1 Tax=Palaeococcus ferrophilus TaxID=83868 RepID=UPI000A008210|nr:class III signal peptide-containing protein [Palaeococcus ferrophilus]
MRRAQSAIEYLFMLAAALILVAVVVRVIGDSLNQINDVITQYTEVMREKLIQNL